MMGKFPAVIFFCALICLFSCSGGGDPGKSEVLVPSDSILPREEMIRLLTEVQITESAWQLMRNRGQDQGDTAGKFYRFIFQKYGISPSRFEASIAFYQQDPEQFAGLYEQVVKNIDSLMLEEAKRDTVKKK